MPLKRNSYHVSRLQSELRAYALHEEDPVLRKKFWSLYYRACNAEHEIRALVMDAEMRRLLDFVFPNGLPDIFEDAKPADRQPQKSDSNPSDNDEDILPKQKRLWE
jgi:hypothetical protein